jgi:hypothetical protein
MIPFKKTTEPQLDIEIANKILEQAFEVNQMEPNTIPLEVLASYSQYRRERFTLQRTILVIVMALFILLPFLFVPPSFTIHEVSDGTGFNPVYQLDVTTFMLVERVSAVIDGHNIPVYEVDSHVYSMEPSRNGRMAVTVTLINRQTLTRYIDVTNVDLDAPAVVSNNTDSDRIYLYLSDPGSGINYEKIKAVDLDGNEVLPVFHDEATGCVAFAYPKESLNVYIPDHADNTLHLILTIQ